MTRIATPPSVNAHKHKSKPYELGLDAVDIPRGEWYRVDITVSCVRETSDVDNRIKPVLEALARKGLPEEKIVYISCRFGLTNSVEIYPVRRRCN